MGQLIVSGPAAGKWLNTMLTNNIDKLGVGQGQYTFLLSEDGGIIDDLIVYRIENVEFLLVVNAARTDEDFAWLDRHRPTDVDLKNRSTDFGGVAIQGPRVAELFHALFGEDVDLPARNHIVDLAFDGAKVSVARTGYTGEDGVEVFFRTKDAVKFWNAVLEKGELFGIKPCGLGARDTLRLEAGMNLYGQDMDEDVSPYEAALAWTVALDAGRDFIGRAVLEKQKAEGAPRQMIGLVMDEKGVLRHGQKVLTAHGDGEILSGTFSPTLGKAIAFARVPAGEPGAVRVDIRGKEVPVRVVKFPFVREGASLVPAK
jgi:aminomethyltransferase